MMSMLTDELRLLAYMAGVHTTLLRLGHQYIPAALLSDVQSAVLAAVSSPLRTALLRELDADKVRVTDAGRHLEEAMDRHCPPMPSTGYR